MTEEQLSNEFVKSANIKDNMCTLKGHVDTMALARRNNLPTKKSPPRFGISSKSMKIEKVIFQL